MDMNKNFDGKEMRKVIIASCVGTLIEWYDFFVFASLATTLGPLFYSSKDAFANTISFLLTSVVGFIVRPFGAMFFGFIGDVFGRKFTFLLTLSLMGVSTALVGALPTIPQIGGVAPGILLVTLRIIQGLALGGEYGGAVVYIAEYSPDHARGYWTSYIQVSFLNLDYCHSRSCSCSCCYFDCQECCWCRCFPRLGLASSFPLVYCSCRCFSLHSSFFKGISPL